jgi:glycerophosphoryl diester phosphodiesterase
MSQRRIPRIIGHRGAKASAPENTLAGIRQARREGASWVEFDVKLTQDGHAILMHDDTLERTTDGAGPVAAATLADIRRLDAGVRFGPAWQGERVPTLSEALAVMAELEMGFNLEIKPCPGRAAETARAAMAALAAHWPAERPAPIVSSFNRDALAAARAAAARGPTFGYLVDELPLAWADEVIRLGCASVHVGWRKLTRPQVAAVKDAGYALIVWTVNEPPRARELLGWGADAIISDCPAALAGV